MVVKTNGKEVDGYLVELGIFGTDQHWCGCQWFECHKAIKSEPVSPCKHIRMVVEHVVTLAQCLTSR